MSELYGVIESMETEDGTKIEVLEYKSLKGSADIRTAEDLFFLRESGISLKTIRITLNNSSVRIEPGSLYYMHGDLEMKASSGGGVLKGLKRKMLSGETFFVNEVEGTGQIYLEPTFGHFFLYKITPEEQGIIVDKSLFYAGTKGLDISSKMQKRISSAAFGKEGLFQTHIAGDGIAVLYSPVPREEIQEICLEEESLYVDGNFAMLRSEGIDFSVTKSSKSWIATSVSKEGLLQKFEGTGYVFIAPTQGTYEQLVAQKSIINLNDATIKRNTKTDNDLNN